MLLYLRSAVFFCGYVLFTVSYGFSIPFIALLPNRPKHYLAISWCWVIISWLRLTCGVRYRVLGREHLERNPLPNVVLAKHQSSWETLKLQSIFFPCTTVLKRELYHIPIFGWGLRFLRPIAIDRKKPREAIKIVKAEGIKKLQAGLNLLLFPEGTRVAPGQKGNYARSGADIAKDAGVNIVPVAVDSGKCWPAKGFLKHPGLITVKIGEPISTLNKSSRELIEDVEAWIENEMRQLESLAVSP